MAVTNEISLKEAVIDVQTRKFASIRAAARYHCVNPTTLTRRLQGGISQSQQHKQQLLISEESEQLLKRWILESEAAGHPTTHQYIRELAGLVSRQSGGPEKVGVNWVQRFIQRHPDIKSKVGRKIDGLRIQATTRDALVAWYDRFHSVQSAYKVKPANIWNMDETGIGLGICHNQYVIGKSSTNASYVKSPQNPEWVSIIETISATGLYLRPVVIFKGQTLQTSWFLPENCPDWLYSTSQNGWSSNDIGIRWLKEVFLPETATNETRILLLDGHGSHCTDEFMITCLENNVRVIYLPPHSSHVLQPLDLACFSAIKSHYRSQIANLSRFEDSAPVKKIRFIQYYDKARKIALKPATIKSGWQAAGIVPWNPRKALFRPQ